MQPIKMTRAEYEAKYGAPAPVSSSTTPTPIKMTRAEYEAKYNPKEPGFVQSLAQSVAAGPLQLASNIRGIGEGVKKLGTAYNQYKAETGKSGIGNVLSDIKANAPTINKTLESYTPTKYSYDYGYLGKQSNVTTPKEAIGTAANIASLYTGGGTVTGLYNTLGKGFLGKALPAAKEIARNVVLPGGATGGLGLAGEALQQGKSYTEAAKEFGKGAAIGAGASLVLGPVAGKTFQVLKNKVAPSAEVISSKIDDSIRNVYKGTTADLAKQNESAFKAKKGLDLLAQEAKNIKIIDDKAPIGATKEMPTKAFNMKKATPNEFVSAVTEMGNKIAGIARDAAQKAKDTGLKLDITEARNKIDAAVNAGDIPQATGLRLQKQLDNLNGDPLSIHDWVQGINSKYGSRYEKGTIDDMATSKLADDIANTLRSKLDTIVDRSGYAEAFGNNQELKRLMVTAAKKANKQVDWGDITSDAGLDAAFAILTGNPAYMARTFGTTLLRGVFNKIRSGSEFKNIKKAAVLSGKVEGKAKLPSKDIKLDMSLKRLPAPSYIPAKAPEVKNTSSIRVTNTNADPRTMSTTKLLSAPEPRITLPNTQGTPNPLGRPYKAGGEADRLRGLKQRENATYSKSIESPNASQATKKSTVQSEGKKNIIKKYTNAAPQNVSDGMANSILPKEQKVNNTNRLISEETYQKAKKSFEEKMTSMNSGVRVDAIVPLTQMAAYHIENGVKSAVELGKVLAKELGDKYNLTKEQLDNLFNEASKNKTTLPKVKSADDMIADRFGGASTKDKLSKSRTDLRDEIADTMQKAEVGITMKDREDLLDNVIMPQLDALPEPKSDEIIGFYNASGDKLASGQYVATNPEQMWMYAGKDTKVKIFKKKDLANSNTEEKTAFGERIYNPEFASIYNRSKVAKKKFGDKDSKTMYGVAGLGLAGASSVSSDK